MRQLDCTRQAAPRKSFFSALPNDLQDDPRLKPRDLAVIASILRFAHVKNWASMSNRTLASLNRCTERTIQLCLARLEAAGWIRRVATDAAIGSNTGRLIYLTWREGEANCAPRASGIAPPGVKSAAPELEAQEEKEKPAPMGLDSPGPTTETKDAGPEAPAGPSDPRPPAPSTVQPAPSTVQAEPPAPAGPLDYASLGWLDRPASDPLRRIAEKALAARLAGPPEPAQKPSCPPRSIPAVGMLTGLLGRSLGGRRT